MNVELLIPTEDWPVICTESRAHQPDSTELFLVPVTAFRRLEFTNASQHCHKHKNVLQVLGNCQPERSVASIAPPVAPVLLVNMEESRRTYAQRVRSSHLLPWVKCNQKQAMSEYVTC